MIKLTQKQSVISIAMASLLLINTTHASIKPAILDQANQQIVNQAAADSKKFQETKEDACADPNEDGSLAQKQLEVMTDQKKMATKPVNLGKLYDMGKKGGCFVALSDFPDLSMSIPSLTSVMNSVKNTLINYAIRKTCQAVDQAFSEMLEPLEAALNSVSDRGQIDLTGAVNQEVSKKLYEVDPELGRVSTSADSAKEIDFKW